MKILQVLTNLKNFIKRRPRKDDTQSFEREEDFWEFGSNDVKKSEIDLPEYIVKSIIRVEVIEYAYFCDKEYSYYNPNQSLYSNKPSSLEGMVDNIYKSYRKRYGRPDIIEKETILERLESIYEFYFDYKRSYLEARIADEVYVQRKAVDKNEVYEIEVKLRDQFADQDYPDYGIKPDFAYTEIEIAKQVRLYYGIPEPKSFFDDDTEPVVGDDDLPF